MVGQTVMCRVSHDLFSKILAAYIIKVDIGQFKEILDAVRNMFKDGDDNLICQLETTKPTVENVTPFSEYEQTHPRLKCFSRDQQNELPILYGGGREFLIGAISWPGENLNLDCVEVADFFVLNTYMVIWINAHDTGLQIPYQKVVYHGVRIIDKAKGGVEKGHQLEIVLTLQRDATLDQIFPPTGATDATATMPTVDLVLRPRYADSDRVYNNQLETLFTFSDFGLNRGDSLVRNCNEAIARCMDFYYVEDDDSEEDGDVGNECMGGAGFTGLGEFLQEQTPVYRNAGAADDLADGLGSWQDVGNGAEIDAGMSMEFFGGDQVAGRKKVLDHWDRDLHKRFKS
ncbi:LADA_0H12992g1_1 [Lachancea dasiensis]|uniref:Protein LOT5 n=1 Tax=Lachancea dasiensis TaxID=1072105 RepID=A0A1G4K412_9SACH|nr:LADA_0H12992g1_1 [Lachancea dasiensis]